MKRRLLFCIPLLILSASIAYAQSDGVISLSSKNLYLTVARNAKTTQTITISNADSVEVQVNLFIDTSRSLIIGVDTSFYTTGWSAAISPSLITIPPKGSVDATLTITSPGPADYLTVAIAAAPIGFIGIPPEINIHALSAGTKYVCYGWNSVHPDLFPKYRNDFATLSFDTVTVAAYDITQFDIVMFANVGAFDYDDSIRAAGTGIGPAILPLMDAIYNVGHEVLITSTFGMYESFDPLSTYYSHIHTPRVVAFFDMLGIHFIAFTNYYGLLRKISGVKGDVISDGINLNALPAFADVFSIAASSHTKPILYFNTDTSAYGGFRYDNGSGNRLVYFNLDLNLVSHLPADQNMLGNLISNSMDFLLGTAEVKKSEQLSFSLEQNYPNPATNQTTISYKLFEHSAVLLSVRDLLGREVARLQNAIQDAGNYTVNFDASNLPSGMYIYTLTVGGEKAEKILTVMK